MINCFEAHDSYAIHTASMTTSGPASVSVQPNGDGSNGISISAEELNIVTNCRAGYNLTISGPDDRNLYRDGDSTNNTPGQFFTPVDGTSMLSETTNAWGYSLTANDESGVFTPLSTTPAFLKTIAQTVSQTDINDTFSVYYGVSVSSTINPGSYHMANNGTVIYQLTMDPSCADYEIVFNPNGGTGTMDNQAIVINEATRITANSFTAPAKGASYQNANGATISATANKLWAFWGWNTNADGTGDWYKNREQVTNLVNQGETITLYAQWKQATLSDMTTPTSGTKTITHSTMQDMSGAICWNSDKFTAIGTPYGQATLTDDRDGTVRSYTIARLQDGNCWMTQNLNLGASTAITLTSDDTDLEEGTTFTLPASSPNDFSTSNTQTNYNKATVLNNITIPDYTVNNTTYSGKVTAYYSFSAATADSNTYSITNFAEVPNSICPRSWDLPTSLQYSELKTKGNIIYYNRTDSYGADKSAGNEPYYFVYGGYRIAAGSEINTNVFSSLTSYGYLWTAQNYRAAIGLAIQIRSDGIPNNSVGGYFGSSMSKYYGLGVRCVTNMDDASYTVTFINPDGGATYNKKIVMGESGTMQLNTAWTRNGYRLEGWDTNSSGTNVVYSYGQTITPSSDTTLYAVWVPVYNIRYSGNNASAGSSSHVSSNVAEGDEITLYMSNFSRSGYGFAGWSFDPNAQPGGSSRIYGPHETIEAPAPNTPGETKYLYAVWVPAETGVYMQTWHGCESLNIGDVIALKDQRDNDTYAVAKLADGMCWMIENLRTLNQYTSDSSLAQGYGGKFVGLAATEAGNWRDSTSPNSIYYFGTQSGTATVEVSSNYYMPRYNSSNVTNRSSNPSAENTSLYSKGNYYTWPAATANTTGKDDADTSICPAGWHLPYGRSNGKGNTPGGYYYLNYKMNNNSNVTDSSASKKLRSYPNNFILSCTNVVCGMGNYWTSSRSGIANIYTFYLTNSSVNPGTSYTQAASTSGLSVRCVAAEGLEVTLMTNDGTGRVGGRVYGEAGSTVSFSAPTRDGYTFSSWNTAADGSGTSYTNSYTFSAQATTGITLYAQWTAN